MTCTANFSFPALQLDKPSHVLLPRQILAARYRSKALLPSICQQQSGLTQSATKGRLPPKAAGYAAGVLTSIPVARCPPPPWQ